ncbi:hypothetical protein HAX54_028127 [Datura stramonium]|uniref:Uncharacterized protein n=1 Tax=Datura stramonium TaxID=4076 RepID=A0ABS8S9E5_DATST|nr:hypothetical protein [Datura stramonium]
MGSGFDAWSSELLDSSQRLAQKEFDFSVLIQNLVNKELDKPSNRCGCKCVDQNGDGKCEEISAPKYRAVRTDFTSFGDLLMIRAKYLVLSHKLSIRNFLEAAFFSNLPVYNAQRSVLQLTFSPLDIGSVAVQQGYRKGNSEGKINEIIAAYDFLNSNRNSFNAGICITLPIRMTQAINLYGIDKGSSLSEFGKPSLSTAMFFCMQIVLDLASNAYLQFLLGPSARMLFEFVKEMPKPETKLRLTFASLLGPLGLKHGWFHNYFLIFGSLVGLKFFLLNDYSIQFVFYFIYINLQVSLAFLVAAFFSNVKTATVIGYMMVFANGLLAAFLFQFFLQDESFPRGWIIVMELLSWIFFFVDYTSFPKCFQW